MVWQPEIDELERRTRLAHEMGGKEKVARQHEFGNLTIRERIDAIADPGSFHEIGVLAGAAQYDEQGNLTDFRPANFVFGTAEIDGRPVLLSGDDFTVRGGSAEAAIPAKRAQSEGLALELGLPHVRLVDGMGGGGSVKSIEIAGRTYIPELRGCEVVVQHLTRWQQLGTGACLGLLVRMGGQVALKQGWFEADAMLEAVRRELGSP